MKQTDLKGIQEILYSYYNNRHLPVWIYDQDFELCFTNFTNPALLSLMEAIHPLAKKYSELTDAKSYHLIDEFPNELYFSFTLDLTKHRTFTVIAGPVLLVHPAKQLWCSLSFHSVVWKEHKETVLNLLPVFTADQFLDDVHFVMELCGVTPPDFTNYSLSLKQRGKSILYPHYCDLCCEPPSAEDISHTHELEISLRHNVKHGHPQRISNLLQDGQTMQLLFPTCNFKDAYIYAISYLSMAKIAAVDGGLGYEATLRIYLSYFEAYEKCSHIPELQKLTADMFYSFANSVNRISAYINEAYSPMINKCIQIIIDKIPGKLCLDDIAEEVHLSSKYLSTLFCKETGKTITDFIQDIRIKEAEHLLTRTTYSFSEISSMLNFSTQSYFNCIFKKKTGLTPKEFRIMNEAAEKAE